MSSSYNVIVWMRVHYIVVTNNSSFQKYLHLDDHNIQTNWHFAESITEIVASILNYKQLD